MDKLRSLFSDYRAEWSSDLFDAFFINPPYFSQLEIPRSCKLMGGRGTGKTTALRSLRFDVTMPRLGLSDPRQIPYFGVYLRVNKNRVYAFAGPELSATDWGELFAHYMNLLICLEFCELTVWLRDNGLLNDSFSVASVALSLTNSAELADEAELKRHIQTCLIHVENFVNNPTDQPRIFKSMAESPIRYFAEELSRNVNTPKPLIFCCIDEYENLTDEQQAILNTYIKHAEPPLSYKFGVRQHGHRTHRTRDLDDLLTTPDDYQEVDIATAGFDNFAENVATRRLQFARDLNLNIPTSLTEFVPGLSVNDEALILGAEKHAAKVRGELANSPELTNWLGERTTVELFFLEFWRAKSNKRLVDLASSWQRNPSVWETRIGNHLYASLFWINKGWKGKRLRKYYSGWKTFILMASGNIRYFLELLDESISVQIDGEGFHGELTPKAQTKAATRVGARRLKQLEGLTENGIEIKRIALGIGRVFFELARTPNHAPEVNQFILAGEMNKIVEVAKILDEGASHLAFEALKPTKATTPDEKQDTEYRLHPIFSAYFEYSHRQKRRASFDAASILKFGDNPRQAMRDLLGTDFKMAEQDEMPEQIALFSDFYEGGND
ncbi:ORC-CDC6 family AAA ATPase [Enhygromyxa salina]|uniref:Uncharacterized protein n=1 Tax=Enhygromyxa salina TaxID=215803 RepID=A0A2S9YLT3_9BACT|nr:hypothetical protein [Enhygromyxa salina]PRQ06006.1 hypothetical protein ENSA7_42680 [Enhygromyxa salina]